LKATALFFIRPIQFSVTETGFYNSINVWQSLICFKVDPFNTTANLLQSKERLKSVKQSQSVFKIKKSNTETEQ
jgi:hypothetical protein